MATADRRCSCDQPQAHLIRSRHSTSEGKLVWGECVCGALHAWLYRAGEPAGVLVAGGPSAPAANAGAISVVHLLHDKERDVG